MRAPDPAPAFVEMQDIGPELFVVEEVGRPVEMPGQAGDLREVDVDGSIGVAAQDQLLLHAFLEGCHTPSTLPLPNRLRLSRMVFTRSGSVQRQSTGDGCASSHSLLLLVRAVRSKGSGNLRQSLVQRPQWNGFNQG